MCGACPCHNIRQLWRKTAKSGNFNLTEHTRTQQLHETTTAISKKHRINKATEPPCGTESCQKTLATKSGISQQYSCLYSATYHCSFKKIYSRSKKHNFLLQLEKGTCQGHIWKLARSHGWLYGSSLQYLYTVNVNRFTFSAQGTTRRIF